MSVNKEGLFNKCLDIVNGQIEKYQAQMDGITEKNEDYKLNPDFDEYGNKGEILTNYEKYAGYLDRAREGKETLANLDINHKSEVVRLGSVVETTDHYYFISVPLGEITMDDGSQIFTISTEAPIYQHLDGKKVGHKFHFNDKEEEIINIF